MDFVVSAQLANNGLFHGTDIAALEHLLDDCARFVLAAGDTLLEPGTDNDCLYVVLRGELRVHLGAHAAPAHTVLGVGECVGEMSLLHGQKVSALVVAAHETELLVVPQNILWALIERSHGFARNLLAILSGRMRNNDLALVTTASHSLEFEQAASVDALTGLHNRRWLSEAFPRTIRRCEQDGAPLCLVIADIDHFRRLNDKQGHLAGDTVLRAAARRIAECLRSQDLIARYGGKDFAILLPQTDTDEGLRIAERLRQSVEEMSLATLTAGAVSSITVSCGVAPLGLDATLDSLLDKAAGALQQAKDGGRNRVEIAA